MFIHPRDQALSEPMAGENSPTRSGSPASPLRSPSPTQWELWYAESDPNMESTPAEVTWVHSRCVGTPPLDLSAKIPPGSCTRLWPAEDSTPRLMEPHPWAYLAHVRRALLPLFGEPQPPTCRPWADWLEPSVCVPLPCAHPPYYMPSGDAPADMAVHEEVPHQERACIGLQDSILLSPRGSHVDSETNTADNERREPESVEPLDLRVLPRGNL